MPVNWILPPSHPPTTKGFERNLICFLPRSIFGQIYKTQLNFPLHRTKDWDKIWSFSLHEIFLAWERWILGGADQQKVERTNLIFPPKPANMTSRQPKTPELSKYLTKTASLLKQKPEHVLKLKINPNFWSQILWGQPQYKHMLLCNTSTLWNPLTSDAMFEPKILNPVSP